MRLHPKITLNQRHPPPPAPPPRPPTPPTHPSETAALWPYVIKAFMAKRMNGRRKETGSLRLSLFSDTSVLTHSSKTVVALFFIKGQKGKLSKPEIKPFFFLIVSPFPSIRTDDRATLSFLVVPENKARKQTKRKHKLTGEGAPVRSKLPASPTY